MYDGTPAQWKYSPGILAQLLVIATFIPANKKTALSQIHQVYAGMDLELLVGEPINPAELSDHLFANMLDRIWEARCDNILSTIALTVRTVFDLPPDYILSNSLISLREKNISHRIHPPEIKLDNAKPLFQKPL